MKFIRPAALFLLLGSASGLAAAADASLTSFADLYRLTVSGAQPAPAVAALEPGARAEGSAEPALRPVSSEAPPARTAFTVAAPPQLAGYAFSIGHVPEPQRWLLLLSGLAAAAWVARRRLYSF